MEIKTNSTQTETTNEQVVEQQPVEEVEQVEEKVEKTYTQTEYNNALAKLRKSYEKKIADINKRPILEKALVENGCKKEAVNDFLKLNKDLFEVGENDLVKIIAQKSKDFSYMFEKKSFTADPFKSVQVEPTEQTKANLKKYSHFFGK